MRQKSLFLLKASLISSLSMLGLSGCYIIQQGMGQLDLRLNQTPILTAAKKEPNPKIKALLLETPKIKSFAESQIRLKQSSNYEGYYQTKYDGVTFVVVAAPKLTLTQKEWWFPIIGSLPYKGYFNPDHAKKLKTELEEQGFDTHIFKATAYSTLGWFKDPLTTPQLKQGRLNLAETLIHEMTHATLFVKNQGKFNEQLASFVGKEGAKAYFTSLGAEGNGFLGQNKGDKNTRTQKAKVQSRLLQETKSKLNQLFASKKPDLQKSQDKKKLYQALQQQLANLYPKADPAQFKYNNARLVLTGLYQEENPIFAQMWKESEGNWGLFWEQTREYVKEKGWGY